MSRKADRPVDVDPIEDGSPRAYWFRTRRPFACFVFLAPLLAAHAVGAVWLGAVAPDTWAAVSSESPVFAYATGPAGFAWAVPIAVGGLLLMWNGYGYFDWRCRAETVGGMLSEAVLFAWALVALAALLGALTAPPSEATATPTGLAAYAVTLVGGGLYAESTFRLVLLPLVHTVLTAAGTAAGRATAIAFLVSGLASAVAYFIGPAGESVAVTDFAFRALAGCGFAWLFWYRGFGVAAGTHAVYELLAAMTAA